MGKTATERLHGTLTGGARRFAALAGVLIALMVFLAGCSGSGSGASDGPVAKDDRVSAVEGKDKRLNLLANDEGDRLVIGDFDPNKIMGGVSCELPNTDCLYIAAPGFTGTERFSYTAKDSEGRTDTAEVVVEVKSKVAPGDVDKKLVARDDRASTAEGKPVMIDMAANDEGQEVEIGTILPGKVRGSVICDADIESGRLLSCEYDPVDGFTGTDKFSYTAKDAGGNTDEAEVVVEVEPAG